MVTAFFAISQASSFSIHQELQESCKWSSIKEKNEIGLLTSVWLWNMFVEIRLEYIFLFSRLMLSEPENVQILKAMGNERDNAVPPPILDKMPSEEGIPGISASLRDSNKR